MKTRKIRELLAVLFTGVTSAITAIYTTLIILSIGEANTLAAKIAVGACLSGFLLFFLSMSYGFYMVMRDGEYKWRPQNKK